jgi:hypothetical protein
MNHFSALTALFVLLGGPVHAEDVSKLKAVKASSKAETGCQGNRCVFCRQRLGRPEDSGMETNLDGTDELAGVNAKTGPLVQAGDSGGGL